MRVAVCLSLLAGLLVGLAEGYAVPPAILPGAATEEELQLVAGRGGVSKESLENDIDKDIVLSGENYIDSRERYDRSFIASEETEEGKLWIDDDDPDWTPSETQGNDGPAPPPQDTEEPFPVKRKRNVKTSYQVVQVPTVHGSEQDAANSGSRGNIQEGDSGDTQVSTGVEPLKPVEGLNQQEVGAGVEPETVGKDSGGSTTGGWLQQGWKKFTGAVDDLGNRAQDTFRNLGDKITEKYNDLREKLPQVVARFKALILKFGTVVQEGALYCLRRFDRAVDKARESQVIVKLEQELKEGHAEVTKFFQILGEKVQAWREQHGSANIDAGLTGSNTQAGQTQLEEGPQRQDIEQSMPDFFQDDQVLVQLNKLTEAGVLTQDDVVILTQQHQNQQNQQQSQQESQQQGQQSQQQGQQSQNSDFQQQNQQDQNSDIQQQNQNSDIQQQNQNSDIQQQNQNSDIQQQNQNSDIQQQSQQDQNSNIQQQSQQQNYYQQPSRNYDPKFIQFPQQEG